MFKCNYKKLIFFFYELKNLDKDNMPEDNEFCLLKLKDGRYTAGIWTLFSTDEDEIMNGEFYRGQFDSIAVEEVSKWVSLDYDLSASLEKEELENLHFRDSKDETLSFTLTGFKSLKDSDFPKNYQYCLLILTNGRISGGRWEYMIHQHEQDGKFSYAGRYYGKDKVWAWVPLSPDRFFEREQAAEEERRHEEELNRNPSVDHNKFIYGTDVNIYYEKALEKLRKEYPWASLAQMKKEKPWGIVPLHGRYVFGQEDKSFDGSRLVIEWTDGSTSDEFIDFLSEYTRNSVKNSNPEEKFKFGMDIEVYINKAYENVKKDYHWLEKKMLEEDVHYEIKQVDGDWEFVRRYVGSENVYVCNYSSSEGFVECLEEDYKRAALSANPVVAEYAPHFEGIALRGDWHLEKYVFSKLKTGNYKVNVQGGSRTAGGAREFFITPYCFEAKTYEEFLERYLEIVPGYIFGLSEEILFPDEELKHFLGY